MNIHFAWTPLWQETLIANFRVVGALYASYVAGLQFGFQWGQRHPFMYPTAWDPLTGKPFYLVDKLHWEDEPCTCYVPRENVTKRE